MDIFTVKLMFLLSINLLEVTLLPIVKSARDISLNKTVVSTTESTVAEAIQIINERDKKISAGKKMNFESTMASFTEDETTKSFENILKESTYSSLEPELTEFMMTTSPSESTRSYFTEHDSTLTKSDAFSTGHYENISPTHIRNVEVDTETYRSISTSQEFMITTFKLTENNFTEAKRHPATENIASTEMEQTEIATTHPTYYITTDQDMFLYNNKTTQYDTFSTSDITELNEAENIPNIWITEPHYSSTELTEFPMIGSAATTEMQEMSETTPIPSQNHQTSEETFSDSKSTVITDLFSTLPEQATFTGEVNQQNTSAYNKLPKQKSIKATLQNYSLTTPDIIIAADIATTEPTMDGTIYSLEITQTSMYKLDSIEFGEQTTNAYIEFPEQTNPDITVLPDIENTENLMKSITEGSEITPTGPSKNIVYNQETIKTDPSGTTIYDLLEVAEHITGTLPLQISVANTDINVLTDIEATESAMESTSKDSKISPIWLMKTIMDNQEIIRNEPFGTTMFDQDSVEVTEQTTSAHNEENSDNYTDVSVLNNIESTESAMENTSKDSEITPSAPTKTRIPNQEITKNEPTETDMYNENSIKVSDHTTSANNEFPTNEAISVLTNIESNESSMESASEGSKMASTKPSKIAIYNEEKIKSEPSGTSMYDQDSIEVAEQTISTYNELTDEISLTYTDMNVLTDIEITMETTTTGSEITAIGQSRTTMYNQEITNTKPSVTTVYDNDSVKVIEQTTKAYNKMSEKITEKNPDVLNDFKTSESAMESTSRGSEITSTGAPETTIHIRENTKNATSETSRGYQNLVEVSKYGISAYNEFPVRISVTNATISILTETETTESAMEITSKQSEITSIEPSKTTMYKNTKDEPSVTTIYDQDSIGSEYNELREQTIVTNPNIIVSLAMETTEATTESTSKEFEIAETGSLITATYDQVSTEINEKNTTIYTEWQEQTTISNNNLNIHPDITFIPEIETTEYANTHISTLTEQNSYTYDASKNTRNFTATMNTDFTTKNNIITQLAITESSTYNVHNTNDFSLYTTNYIPEHTNITTSQNQLTTLLNFTETPEAKTIKPAINSTPNEIPIRTNENLKESSYKINTQGIQSTELTSRSLDNVFNDESTTETHLSNETITPTSGTNDITVLMETTQPYRLKAPVTIISDYFSTTPQDTTTNSINAYYKTDSEKETTTNKTIINSRFAFAKFGKTETNMKLYTPNPIQIQNDSRTPKHNNTSRPRLYTTYFRDFFKNSTEISTTPPEFTSRLFEHVVNHETTTDGHLSNETIIPTSGTNDLTVLMEITQPSSLEENDTIVPYYFGTTPQDTTISLIDANYKTDSELQTTTNKTIINSRFGFAKIGKIETNMKLYTSNPIQIQNDSRTPKHYTSRPLLYTTHFRDFFKNYTEMSTALPEINNNENSTSKESTMKMKPNDKHIQQKKLSTVATTSNKNNTEENEEEHKHVKKTDNDSLKNLSTSKNSQNVNDLLLSHEDEIICDRSRRRPYKLIEEINVNNSENVLGFVWPKYHIVKTKKLCHSKKAIKRIKL